MNFHSALLSSPNKFQNKSGKFHLFTDDKFIGVLVPGPPFHILTSLWFFKQGFNAHPCVPCISRDME